MQLLIGHGQVPTIMPEASNIVWICSQSLENMVDLYSAEGR